MLNLLYRASKYGPKKFVECLTENRQHLNTVTLTICWCEWLKCLRGKDSVVDESPSSGSSMKRLLVELVLRKALGTASQGES